MGLLVNAAQAGFVARQHSHGVGLVGQRAEGGGENHAAIDLGEFQLQFRFLGDHFAIDEVGFDTGGAANAPTGRDHLGDQVLLLQGDRFVHGVVLFDHALEVFGILECLWGNATEDHECSHIALPCKPTPLKHLQPEPTGRLSD